MFQSPDESSLMKKTLMTLPITGMKRKIQMLRERKRPKQKLLRPKPKPKQQPTRNQSLKE